MRSFKNVELGYQLHAELPAPGNKGAHIKNFTHVGGKRLVVGDELLRAVQRVAGDAGYLRPHEVIGICQCDIRSEVAGDLIPPVVVEMIGVFQELPAVQGAADTQRDGDAAFRREWTALLTADIIPAVRRYRNYLQTEYAPGARQAIAVTALPGGADCYRASLRYYTTVERSADQMWQVGEQQVARQEGEARDLAVRLLGTGDLEAVRRRLDADPAGRFGSRDELLAFSRDAVERARRAAPGWFTTLPAATVVVEAQPAYLERTSSNNYSAAPPDRSGPGIYRIRLYEAEQQTRANAELTAFHETFPGHHVQIELANERRGMHPIARLPISTGFVEGWARYAEMLAEEMGLYTSDAARLNRRFWPGHGILVDVGIHARGWTHEQAVTFIAATGRKTRAESESLVDRIVMWPGQLTSYDTGAIEIVALRDRARKALGARFDIKAFHDAILDNGAVTLPMLTEAVDRWIAARVAESRDRPPLSAPERSRASSTRTGRQ